MKVLWIEDQPGSHEEQLFTPENIDGTIHKLIKTECFDNAYEKVECAHKNVDLIVIDINLEHFEAGKEGASLMDEFRLSEREFLSEAGFHLYLRLMQQGFDKERIVFLSAYTIGNQFETLRRKLNEARQEQDEAKINAIFENLEKALSEFPEEMQDLQEAVDEYDDTGSLDLTMLLLDVLSEKEEEKNSQEDSLTNQYGKFRKIFKEARLPLAKSIKKTNYADFQLWLKERLDPTRSPDLAYAALRRGIIEGCRELKDKLVHVKKNKLEDFLLFYKTTEILPTEQHRQHAIDYLTKLEHFFPLHPPHNREQWYGLFLKEISADWEMSSWEYLNRNLKAVLGFSEVEYRFKSFCQTQMKLLRNWTAHNSMTPSLNEKDVAYLFMLAMRGWLNLPVDNIYVHEKMLGVLFERVKTLRPVGSELAQSYYAVRKRLSQEQFYRNPRGNEFTDLLKALTGLIESKPEKAEALRTQIQRDSMRLYYQNFWHNLFPAELSLGKNKPEKDFIGMYINFRELERLVDDSKALQSASFIYFLGRLIYQEAFGRTAG